MGAQAIVGSINRFCLASPSASLAMLRSVGRLLTRPVTMAAQRPAVVACRPFASNPLEATAKLYEDLVGKAVKEFQANQKTVSAELDAELSGNKMVLFMEGTPDAPKSEASLNTIRMLTQVQAANFLAVDVLSHPAILGYRLQELARPWAPPLRGRQLLRRSRRPAVQVQQRRVGEGTRHGDHEEHRHFRWRIAHRHLLSLSSARSVVA